MPLADRAGFLLSKLGRLAGDVYTERLSHTGLRPQHYALLVLIAERQGASQLELGQLLHLAPSGVVSVLDELEGLGAVRRSRSDVDRRRHVLLVTSRGHEILSEAQGLAAAVEDELLKALEPAERRTLLRLLRRVAQSHDLVPDLTEGSHTGG